jgi:hypothetical protein
MHLIKNHQRHRRWNANIFFIVFSFMKHLGFYGRPTECNIHSITIHNGFARLLTKFKCTVSAMHDSVMSDICYMTKLCIFNSYEKWMQQKIRYIWHIYVYFYIIFTVRTSWQQQISSLVTLLFSSQSKISKYIIQISCIFAYIYIYRHL